MIVQAAQRLDRMVTDLLDAAAVESRTLRLHPEEMDLGEILRSAVEQARFVSEQHSFVLHAPSHEILGRWDGDRLQQLLGNLLVNAIKYSPGGGEIVITVNEEDDAGSSIDPRRGSRAAAR